MTTHHSDLPLLTTDADVLARIRHQVGRASAHRQLWILFVDGDDRQAPVVMPVAEMPAEPGPGTTAGLTAVLSGFGDELATDRGPGSVILAWERRGPDDVVDADRAWALALTETCRQAGIALRGTFLSTPGGVRPLAGAS